MIIRVEVCALPGSHGDAERVSENVFKIRLNKDDAIITRVLTFLHEIRHVACWRWTPFDDLKKEHKFIEACERHDKKEIQKWWIGE